MPGRRMLRDMMSVNDIYSYAETIIELLREEYGSYDADTLDEVQVEERFAQRLEARGYDVRSPAEAAPAPTPTPAPTPAPVTLSQDTPIVPVTVVRARRAASGSTGSSTAGGTSGGATRGRRATPSGDGTRPPAGSESSRASSESARPAPESSADTSSDSSSSGSETSSRPVRQRRIVRPRTNNNGDSSS